MKKKYAGMFMGFLMAFIIAFPAIAAEAAVDVPVGEAADASEIAVFTEDIPDADTGEDAAFMSDIPEEDGISAVTGDAEEITADVPAGDYEEITADVSNVDSGDIAVDIPVGDEEEAAADYTAEEAASADEASEKETDETEQADDGVMLLSTTEPEDDEISVTGVSLNKTKVTINTKDQALQLMAMVTPSDATDPSVTWKSNDTKVVTVDADGKLTAVKDGTATITVTTTDGGYTAECTVTVSLYSDGFHQDPDGSDWCYYKNGKIATGTTDIIQGTVNGTKGYWNVVKGRVEASATVAQGTVDGTTAWWYVNKKGMVDTSYTGFATNSNGSWYAENGKVTKKTNGVIKDTTGALGSSSAWYYVLNSKVQYDFTGLADYSNASGWWYVTNGKVDRSVTTIAKNKNGWWYVANGKVDKTYTGFGTNSNGSWYAENGKVTKKVNGVFKDTTGALGSKSDWYYVVGSKVQTNFTGLADYSNASGWWYVTNGRVDRSVTTIAKNKNGWWYVENGKVNKSYTGFGTNSNGSWYAENGKVTKTVNGVYKDTTGALGSSSDWYYVLNSKVQYSFTGLADYSNASGWWYITNGKVDRSYNGLAKNQNGWYYLTNGKVDSSFTGTAQNSNGWWYVENGKVDKSVVALVKVDGVWQAYKSGKFASDYTGIAENENGMWYVVNGVLDRSYSGTYTDSSGTWTVTNGKVSASASGERGWVKVGSDYYYYDRSTGKMATSTTVDGIKLDSTGKAQASSEDVTKIQTMIKARERMLKVTNTSDSNSEKLRKCFDWAADISYNRFRYLSQEKSKSPNNWICAYANDAFDSAGGDCYASACAFAFMAHEIGYDAVVCDTNGHAWVEINGLVYDPGMTVGGYYGKYYATAPEEAGEIYWSIAHDITTI